MRIADRTRQCYTITVNHYTKAAKELKIHDRCIAEFKRAHIMLLTDKCTTMRNWSNKAINKHLDYLKSMLSKLIEWNGME